MTFATACSAQTASDRAELGFLCAVKGAELLPANMTSISVCATFKDRIDKTLANPTQTMKALSGAGGADWIRLDIRFSKPGTAAALVVQNQGGRQVSHPEIAVDVMDKPLGENEVKKLADEVAKLVSGKTGR